MNVEAYELTFKGENVSVLWQDHFDESSQKYRPVKSIRLFGRCFQYDDLIPDDKSELVDERIWIRGEVVVQESAAPRKEFVIMKMPFADGIENRYWQLSAKIHLDSDEFLSFCNLLAVAGSDNFDVSFEYAREKTLKELLDAPDCAWSEFTSITHWTFHASRKFQELPSFYDAPYGGN